MGNKILLIEDTTELAALITLYLNKEGMEIKPVESGEEALTALESFQPELVLLDLNLPGMGGFEFLQIFRKTSQVPVLIISARDSEEDIIQGLGDGADEYITKPFSPKVLVARVQAMLRRAGSTSETTAQEQTFQFGPFHLYCDRYLLTRNGQRIPLSSKEFSILEYLIRNSGTVLSRERISNHIWNYDYEGGSNIVDVYIRYLRKKIYDGFEKKLIHTVRGVGYVLREET